MGYEFYVTVTGAKQGAFKGDGMKDKNKIIGLGFRDAVSIPIAASSGAGAGKRQYSPVSFTKQWGPSSPQFIQALVTNEALTTVLFEFLKVLPSGVQSVYYTIKLTDAQVSEVRQFSGNLSLIASSTAELDEISLVFKKIEITYLAGSVQVVDDWENVT